MYLLGRLVTLLHRDGGTVATVGVRHAPLVNREDGLDLTQRVGGEALVGLIAVALDDAALFLDVDKGVAVHLVGMLVPCELVGEDEVIVDVADAHVAGERPQRLHLVEIGRVALDGRHHVEFVVEFLTSHPFGEGPVGSLGLFKHVPQRSDDAVTGVPRIADDSLHIGRRHGGHQLGIGGMAHHAGGVVLARPDSEQECHGDDYVQQSFHTG